MRFRHTILIAAALITAACGSGAAAEPGAAPSAAASVPATTKSTPVAPTVGDTVEANGMTLRLIKFRPRVRLDITPDGPNNHWSAAKVEACWTSAIAGVGDQITVSWDPWSLLDSQGGRWPAFQSGTGPDNWLTPVYPMFEEDGGLRMGECVTGWIQFPVGDGVTVTEVRWSVDRTDPITWLV